MKNIILLICAIVFSIGKSFSQTENFLRLSRIIAKDSLYNNLNISGSTISLPGTAFTITVPNNVYWKINYISVYAYGGNVMGIKINNHYLTYGGTGPFIERTTSFWVKPSSIIRFQFYVGTSSSTTTINPSYLLSAEEYTIGP